LTKMHKLSRCSTRDGSTFSKKILFDINEFDLES